MNPVLDVAWAKTADLSEVASPALLIGVEAVRENLRRMTGMAGARARLRPHVKTHKLAWLVQEQLALGISKFKCATIAEAEMCARVGAPDVLLAIQPVGPNIKRFQSLLQEFPNTRFSTIVDDPAIFHLLESVGRETGSPFEVLLDLDVGQHRTGVEPGLNAAALYRTIANSPSLRPGGLHVYDGHLHQTDLAVRTAACEAGFARVKTLRDELSAVGLPVPRIVAGGTPTFPMHAARCDVECSPGTCVLWDAGYATNLPDLDFVIAAALLTRIVSKPAHNRLCLDLGHKAVASEMPHPRVVFPDLPDIQVVGHNEEHLIVETPLAERFSVGDAFIGVPWHICPTVALHAEAVLIANNIVVSTPKIEARARRLTL